jgi:RNA polymerase primary sigma factor
MASGGCPPQDLEQLRREARAAEELLVTSHLRLVVKIAKRYQRDGLDVDDLVQEGNIALLAAARLFPTRGRGRFASYARWRVRAAIARAADLSGYPATVPERLARQARRLQRIRSERSLNGEAVDRRELQEALSVSDTELVELERLAAPAILLSTPVGVGVMNLGDTLCYRCEREVVSEEGDAEVARAHLRRHLDNHGGLTPREREIVLGRHGLGDQTGAAEGTTASFADLAPRVGVGAERVRQLYNQAVSKLEDDEELALLYGGISTNQRTTAADEIDTFVRLTSV